jgi:hypothetical protein
MKDDLRDKFKELMPHTRVKCNGYLAYYSEKLGNINYKAVPELQGVDLEKYRAKPSQVFTMRKVK